MKIVKKIFLDQKDNLAKAVKLLVETKADFIVFNAPNQSALGRTIDDFEKFKKQAATLGKEIAIESANEDILRLAEAVGIKTINPLFRREEKIVSDIVPNLTVKPEPAKPETPPPSPPKPIFAKTQKIKTRPKQQLILKLLALVLLLGAGISGALLWLPKATVNIQLKQLSIDFNRLVEVDKSFKKIEVTADKILLPAELLTSRANLQLFFPATGKEKVAEKAKGRLVIYNAYSSEPQTLVVSTRFVSPEGKLFRLDEKITIPGAKIVNGQIQPSSMEASVTADQTGEAFNVKPSVNWRIPGFDGTAKYQGFYAEAKTEMKGGFVGEVPVSSQDDVVKAQAKLESALKENLNSQMVILLNGDLKAFDEAISFKTLKFEADHRANEKNEFSAFAEAEMSRLVFSEEKMKEALTDNLKTAAEAANNLALEAKTFDFRYENLKVDLTNGRLSFNLVGQTALQPVFDATSFINQIAGLNKEALQAKVFSIPGLDRGRIALWPFWVSRVPTRESRIKLLVE